MDIESMSKIDNVEELYIKYLKNIVEAPGIFRGGLTLPTRGLKYGFQGTINAKNLRKNRFHLPMEGLACSDGEAIAPLALP